MRTIFTFLAFIATSLTINAQKSQTLDLNNHVFEVVTTEVPGCFGPDLPFDRLYEVTSGTRREIDFGARCCGSKMKISEISHDPSGQVEKLVVKYTMGVSTFYLIEGDWVSKNGVLGNTERTTVSNTRSWPTPPYGGY